MKIGILIGAGASRYCGYDDELYAPPLGRQLYTELLKEYPNSWGSITDADIIEKFKEDFEQGMSMVWSRQLPITSQLLIDMGVYFTKFDPPEGDFYSQLITVLNNKGLRKKIAVLSLNYECIFEIAVSRMGLKITMSYGHPKEKNILIWKPHGSCNFIPKVSVRDLTLQLSNSKQGYYEGPIEILDLPNVRKKYFSEKLALPPVMSLYTSDKYIHSSRSFLQQQRKNWERWASMCKSIIIIGVRPNYRDEHIWRPILNSRAKVFYVGPINSEVEDLQNILRDRFEHAANSFDEFIKKL